MHIMIRGVAVLAVLLLSLSAPVHCFAQDDSVTSEAAPTEGGAAEDTAEVVPELDTGDTAWMLVSTALVLMMTAPGLALFYGGLVRRKNVLSVVMQCITMMGLMSIVWALWGYSLAFGGSGGFIGNLDHVLLRGVIPTWNAEAGEAVVPMSGTIPASLFMAFQGMFFIITPALICGAIAERVRFAPLCLFLVLWGTLVYCPIAHWVWGDGGWLLEGRFAALDFAGGTVVHVSSGVTALICCLLLGPRYGHRVEPMPPHNMTYTAIGTALLWVGWFGFNAGSALAANATAVNAFVATHLAAAAGVIGWSVAEWIAFKKPTVLGACSGGVAGLVGITPAAGAVDPIRGIAIGLICGVACYLACIKLKNALGYDDSLDAFGVHGVGGAVGALLTGVFATAAITGDPEVVGLVEGNANQLLNQFIGVLAAAGYAAIASAVLFKGIDLVMGFRVTRENEQRGLDLTEHGEDGYIFQ
ncbi:ammonium transporter [Stratiformator vulcanicus]|uniref:Ammonium transporter n=1 Tax=Stratiformator vulcanicus TaxID=2527980 RepID=A0A517QXR2_9PLAN|nr:ammonium transporter [Stratiformator vulcanicus]QDT36446.1 Ammonium transporter NrgA [Stratiformator vulcanicus]